MLDLQAAKDYADKCELERIEETVKKAIRDGEDDVVVVVSLDAIKKLLNLDYHIATIIDGRRNSIHSLDDYDMATLEQVHKGRLCYEVTLYGWYD